MQDKKILFNGWIMGMIHSNALAYLPSLTEGQLDCLQTAVNSGIRAVLDLPRRSSISMTSVREKFGFLSVAEVKEKCLMLAAYKNRANFFECNRNTAGPSTRGKARGDVPHPVIKGHLGKTVSSALASTWNKLPSSIRHEDNPVKAKYLIKKSFKKQL